MAGGRHRSTVLDEPAGMLCGRRPRALGEEIQHQQFRTRVRGTAHSFHMPWEEILQELKDKCESLVDESHFLPRKPECLKYVLKVNLRVDRQNMQKVLKQLTVRPFVLFQLLYFLIEHNHEVFRNKGSVQTLREHMKELVGTYYPVGATEKQKRVEEQEFHLPADIVDFAKPVGASKKKRIVEYTRDKSSTPGDGGST